MMNEMETLPVEISAPDAGLIGDDHQAESHLGKPTQAVRRAGNQVDELRVGEITALDDDRPVPIQKGEASISHVNAP